MKRALYPGTFDPITFGHLDIIKRASQIFDDLTIGVAEAYHKTAYFDLAERRRMVAESVVGIENVRVKTFSGLLAQEFEAEKVNVVIRGLRAVSDFEYELMLALMNRKLNPHFETVFLMPSERYIYLHSSMVREMAELGADVSELVPPPVMDSFRRRKR